MNPLKAINLLVDEVENTQAAKMRKYFQRHRGTRVQVGNLVSKVSRDMGHHIINIDEIESSLRQLTKHNTPEVLARVLDNIHVLIHKTVVPKLSALSFNMDTELPRYIMDNTESEKDPDSFVKDEITKKLSRAPAEQTKSSIRDMIKSFRESFGGCLEKASLGSKVNTGRKIGSGAAVAFGLALTPFTGPVGLAVAGAGAGALAAGDVLKVHDSDWAKKVLNFCCGELEDSRKIDIDKVARFFRDEELSKHVELIKSDLSKWISDLERDWNSWKSIELHVDLLGAQFEQSWSLSKALLLCTPTSIQEHRNKLEILKDKIKSTRNGHMVVALGYLETSTKGKLTLEPDYGSHFSNITGIRVTNQEAHFSDVADFLRKVYNKYTQLKSTFKSIYLGDFVLEKINQSFLNERFNKFYPLPGQQSRMGESFIAISWDGPIKDGYKRGGRPYFCPKGWHRIALTVARNEQEFDEKYSDWPIAYHGTGDSLALTILGMGLKAGDGCFMKSGEIGVYLSPSIEYCAHPFYSKMFKLDDGTFCQMVFQVRVDPKLISLEEQSTIGFIPDESESEKNDRVKIDPNFSNRKLEWIIKDDGNKKYFQFKDGIVIYGIMVRITKESPKKLPTSHWWFQDPCCPEEEFPDP